MDDNAKARRILEWCFTEPEWKWLMKHEAFKGAADAVSTLQGIEHLSAEGATLLMKSQVGMDALSVKGRETPRVWGRC